MPQISRGKFDCLRRATAGFTTSAFDGYGLRSHLPARPAPYASDPVLVHRLASLLHASFRPRLAASVISPLRFAITSRPSRCEEDFHLQTVKHSSARKKAARAFARAARHLSRVYQGNDKGQRIIEARKWVRARKPPSSGRGGNRPRRRRFQGTINCLRSVQRSRKCLCKPNEDAIPPKKRDVSWRKGRRRRQVDCGQWLRPPCDRTR